MKKSKQPYEIAILSAKKQFISIAGKEAWDRELLFLKTFLPMYSVSNVESIKQSILNLAITDVTLNPIFHESYLIERDGKLFLDFTYRGLIKISTSEGAVISMSAGVVYAWDEIKFKEGTKAFLDIIPNLNPPKDPDEIVRNPKLIWEYTKCAYSIATFPNGQQDFIVLPKFKLLKTWNMTSANASPINQMFPEEWIRKTAIIYHSKSLPHAQKLVTAVSVINEHAGVANKKSKPKSRLMQRIKK